ncbi:hypothetical protein BIW11_04219 [Tropilaelaps mercedesae]|uniref:Uncharacterized protein n=1 Tax=Tropilaelaps mercedesae TaxID=418985 RepID=A0A1V9X976_9ACAR|nr:hypothetical protein BIW11_04219 [Tropilaelaps mercedesae]
MACFPVVDTTDDVVFARSKTRLSHREAVPNDTCIKVKINASFVGVDNLPREFPIACRGAMMRMKVSLSKASNGTTLACLARVFRYSCAALNRIAAIAYGIDLEGLENPDNLFVKNVT